MFNKIVGLISLFILIGQRNYAQSITYNVGAKSVGVNEVIFPSPVLKNFGVGAYIGNIDTLKKVFFLRSRAGIEYENLNILSNYIPNASSNGDSNFYRHNIGSFNALISLGSRFQLPPKKRKEQGIIPFIAFGINSKIYFASYSLVSKNGKIFSNGFRLNGRDFFKINDYIALGAKFGKREYTINFENFLWSKYSEGFFYKNDDRRYYFKYINLIIKI